MALSRRDALKALGTSSLVTMASTAQAAPRGDRGPTPIVTPGGTRWYPAWGTPKFWATEPLLNGTWTFPQVPGVNGAPPPELVQNAVNSLAATTVADEATALQDVRNTPAHGIFTRAYFQISTPPLALASPQWLDGTVSAAFHCVQWHRRIGGRLALQVVVHRADGSVRGVALPVRYDGLAFTVGTPARTRAAVGWPLTPVLCEDGDVIAVNVGIYADNQTRTLAQGVGFYVYASHETDIAAIDTDELGNSWVEFERALPFEL